MTDVMATMEGFDSGADDRRTGSDRRLGDGTARYVEAAKDMVTGAVGKLSQKKLTAFEQDFIELIEGLRAGHLSRHEYANGGMKLWEEFLATCPNYYIPLQERALIQRCASASARLLSEQGVTNITLVSFGPGTQFKSKEGHLILAFAAAGIKIDKVIYQDESSLALRRSVKECKEILKQVYGDAAEDVVHEEHKDNLFPEDLDTIQKFDIAKGSVAFAACFGGTPFNAEGRYDAASPPLNTVTKNIESLIRRLPSQSHFVFAADHTSHRETLLNMFKGREEMARHMLKHHMRWDDVSDVDLAFEYGESSHILSQGFDFQNSREFGLRGDRNIKSGTTLWFNNSVKLYRNEAEQCVQNAGGYYPTQQRVIMSDSHPHIEMGYHHTMTR